MVRGLSRRSDSRAVLLRISTEAIVLTGVGRTVRQKPPGAEQVTLDYLRMLDRIRHDRADRLFLPNGGTDALSPQREIGELLFNAYLRGPVGDRLEQLISDEREPPLRVALAVDPDLAGHPWETLAAPLVAMPVALHPRVSLFRLSGGARAWPAAGDAFGVVAAVAQPDDAALPLIDHERDLEGIAAGLAAAARRQSTELRLVPFGTPEAIGAALRDSPCQILHLTCHARPGALLLEDADGQGRPIDAATLVDRVLTGEDGVLRAPFIVLMGCSTGVGRREGETGGLQTVANLAQALMEAGAQGVLAMSAVVGDRYAGLFTRYWYAALLADDTADPAAACAEARRRVEAHRGRVPAGSPEAAQLRDWSAPVLYLREGVTALPGWSPPSGAAPGSGEPVPPVSRRPLIGRRAEERRLRQWLTRRGTVAAVHGIAGIGVSALLERIRDSVDRGALGPAVTLSGRADPDALIARLAERTREPDGAGAGGDWRARLRDLLARLPGWMPPPLIWDDFAENVARTGDGRIVVVEPKAIDLLTEWTSGERPGTALLGSRVRFDCPGELADRVAWCPLPELPRAAVRHIVRRMPALDGLDPEDLETALEVLGGHPGALTALAALPDGRPPHDMASVAEGVRRASAAAALEGLPRDTLDADWLVAKIAQGTSVFRGVFWKTAAAWQVLEEDEERISARRLDLTDHDGRLQAVPPLVVPDRQALDARTRALRALVQAGVITRLWNESGGDERFAIPALLRPDLRPQDARPAHSRAANYWMWLAMAQIGPGSQRDHLTEALHHLYGAARWDEGDAVARDVAARLHRDGDWNAELAIAERALRYASGPGPEAFWLRCSGVLHRLRGEHDRAARLLARALLLARRQGDGEGMMVGHGELGILAQDLGHLKTARRHQESVLELSREQADQLRMAASLSQLGNLDVLEARFSDARERYKAAQEIYREIRNEQGVAATLVQMAMVDEALGRVTEAAAGYGRAISMRASMEDRFNLAQVRHQLGNLLAKQGRTAKAMDLWRASIAAGMETGAWELVASGYHQIATTLQRKNQDPGRIVEYYQRALLIEERLGNPQRTASIFHNLGQLHQELQEYPAAERCYSEAIRLSGGDRDSVALATFQLGVLAELAGDRPLAMERCMEALRTFEEIELPLRSAVVQCQIGVLLCRDGDVLAGADYLLRGYDRLVLAGGSEHIGRALDDLRRVRRAVGAERFTVLLEERLSTSSAERLRASL
ncbi:tetratricopeptide repeat protein [Actinomadura sp. BRA 177]|uniref:CHAT domain-containing tetratricopeptide repeat protein n=1 Tax=Actinomadura sp. BRA 177 TaxID=2745202 RepID=UPI0015950065|nr:tetratricopeptide repeat protein [Actinomadura sp. BRA 177]NVI88188.1 tetratricopeptide repeat protein [Actinomadura sp. BRA 177]